MEGGRLMKKSQTDYGRSREHERGADLPQRCFANGGCGE